ncbi:hypothetical protein OUZ56_009214 [Daphnia magna]|uniref:Uncharacterized protein n=1 Tax=Daphnia magna TaxID=35525 RepID=A0ABR0AFL1_9CRUS|nr:hypothetical protein OUZ56_009214 [Daphnia magna]
MHRDLMKKTNDRHSFSITTAYTTHICCGIKNGQSIQTIVCEWFVVHPLGADEFLAANEILRLKETSNLQTKIK